MYRSKQNPPVGNLNLKNPTKEAFGALTWAYDFFNRELFHGALPHCVITMHGRNKRTYGYFKSDCWEDHQRANVTDEIMLNPDYFQSRSTAEVLSTLVHEMVHLQQHHFGKPGRGRYHNKEWASLMRKVGLVPSSTGKPGGRIKETGQSVSHYIDEGGSFQRVCQKLLATGFIIPWQTLMPPHAEDDDQDGDDLIKKKRASKTKYGCPTCSLNIWAKPKVRVMCVDCQRELAPAS